MLNSFETKAQNPECILSLVITNYTSTIFKKQRFYKSMAIFLLENNEFI